MSSTKNAFEEENGMPRIKKISLIYLPILLVLFCLFSEGAHARQAPPRKSVLVLHGLWRIRTWEIPFNSSLHSELLADKAVTVGITHVYLGLEDFPDSVYPQNLIEELRDRIEKNPVDLVISVMPGADRFLLAYGQALFPGVPVIFAMPGTRDIQQLKKVKSAVIIPSAAEKALQTTVERIFALLPDTKHLVVVCGGGPVDRNYLGTAKRAIASSKQVTKVSYLVGLPLDELWKRVSSLGTDTAILFTTYDEDKNGKKQETTDVGIRLAISANAPVFSFVESLLGNGIVGGNVTSAESYSQDTAKAALRLLKGEQPRAISPNEQISYDVYDWRALKRWNISEDRLPSGSQVRYKTITLWETYKVHIIVGIGVICLETILICALFIALMRNKRIKEALQEGEERHRTLQENIPVGVYRTSHSGKIISVNSAASKMFGFDAEEDLSSYQVTDFYKDPEKRRDFLSQLKTEGKLTDLEVEFRRKDGSLFWGSLSATQVTDEDGNFIFIDGVVQDISERKRAEEKLRYQATLLENVSDAVIAVDMDYKVRSWNDAAENIYGWKAEEVEGKLLSEVTAWEYLDENREEVLDKVQRDGVWWGELIQSRKDGKRIVVQTTLSLVKDKEGVPIGLVGVNRDITIRKQAEEALRNSQEEAGLLAGKLITTQEAERTRLARELHDDITQRLALLNIEVDQLELQDKSLSEPIKERLRQIGENLGELSSDIHMISRRLHPSILDDLGLIKTIESECNNFARLLEVQLTSDLDTTLPNLSTETALCIYRILQEGLRNIGRHARATDIQVQLSQKNNTVYFVLRDNGVGFDLDSSSRRRGLGLASMGERARLINGELSIESRPGKGTVLKLEAPFED
jgi:PAS domain S-box-containing protein